MNIHKSEKQVALSRNFCNLSFFFHMSFPIMIINIYLYIYNQINQLRKRKIVLISKENLIKSLSG